MEPEIPFGVQKELITPRSTAVTRVAQWVLLALCDAWILFPCFFFLLQEMFFGVFTLAFTFFFLLAQERFFGFLCFEHSYIFPFFPLKGLGLGDRVRS